MSDDTLPIVERLRLLGDRASFVPHMHHKAADAIQMLALALKQNAEWFRGYADGHEAKGDTDKAKRNRDREQFNLAALDKVRAMR